MHTQRDVEHTHKLCLLTENTQEQPALDPKLNSPCTNSMDSQLGKVCAKYGAKQRHTAAASTVLPLAEQP
eukprot:scaffold154928_cov18-Tisochrysis_lutea.AAC.1